MTFLQLVNKVLVRLREDEIDDSTADTYSALIAEFVREALSEVEDAHNWNSLRTTNIVTTAANSYEYTLTGVGNGWQLLYVHEDVNDYDLQKAPTAQWMTHALLSNPQTEQPEWYDINGTDSSGDPVVDLYPIPDGVYSVNFVIKTKTQNAVDATVIKVPWLPVVLKAYALALDERGDDQGDTLAGVERRYSRALADAVAYDAGLNPDETVWYED